MRCVHLFATLAVVVFAGCPSRNSDPAPDAADSAAGHDAGGSGGLGGSAPEGGGVGGDEALSGSFAAARRSEMVADDAARPQRISAGEGR